MCFRLLDYLFIDPRPKHSSGKLGAGLFDYGALLQIS